MGKRSMRTVFGGKGFYIALALCLLAVGAAGYGVFFNGETEEPPEAPALSDTPLEVEEPEPVPVEPVPEPEPEPEPETESEPAVSAAMPEVKVEAEQPRLTVSPLSGEIVAAFSMEELQYSETLGDWRTHDGVDIQAQQGTAVTAASAGTVLEVYDDALLGTTVVLSHPGGYETRYACLQAKPTVAAGDSVAAGAVIGAVGQTAAAEAGPHLHFSVTREGEPIDPAEFLNR